MYLIIINLLVDEFGTQWITKYAHIVSICWFSDGWTELVVIILMSGQIPHEDLTYAAIAERLNVLCYRIWRGQEFFAMIVRRLDPNR